MLLCMVVLGGAGSLKGVILGGMLITLFDRVVLTQTTFMVRAFGRTTGVTVLTTADLTLWRWFFFGLGLVLVMLLRPEGLVGRRVRPAPITAADVEDGLEVAPAPRVDAIPAWLRERAQGGVAAATPILDVRGVTKRFGGVIALNEVDLLVPRGAIIGLIGPNGAGKTTLFNVVTGLVRPDGGRMIFDGGSLVGLRPNAIVARGIARTFQSIRLFQNMTVLENALVGEHCRLAASVPGAVLRPPSVIAEETRARVRARELLAFVGLGGQEDELARNLPYGDQRRLEIARALATEPRLLLLDEPSAGMNPQRARRAEGAAARSRARGRSPGAAGRRRAGSGRARPPVRPGRRTPAARAPVRGPGSLPRSPPAAGARRPGRWRRAGSARPPARSRARSCSGRAGSTGRCARCRGPRWRWGGARRGFHRRRSCDRRRAGRAPSPR